MRHHEGFTLIELLVVAAIISLLISVLLPSLTAAKDCAKTVACLANLRALGTADLLYAQGNNQFLFPAGYNLNPWRTTPPPDELCWPVILKEARLIDAPTTSEQGVATTANSPLRCPGALAKITTWGWSWNDGRHSGYGYDMLTSDGKYVQSWYASNGEDWNCHMFPHSKYRGSGGRAYLHKITRLRGNLSTLPALFDGPLIHQHIEERVDPLHHRHKRANIVFMDGHARPVDHILVPHGNYWDWVANLYSGGEVVFPIAGHGERDFGRVD
jgi:prepilin-type N-terminal cleavage/methylation domain-containing protein/prepilin-type processing-associated H-X9-DG protein